MYNYYPNGVYQQSFDSTFHNAQPQYYQRQVPRLQISTPEQPQSWSPSQRPRSVQDTREQVPSPATSVHTTQTTPDISISDRLIYRQSDLSRTNNRVSFNQQSGPSRLSPTYVSPTFNPSVREEPWSLFHLRNTENKRLRCPSRQSNADFSQYSRVGSDMDSSALPSDSGYMSFGTNQSVFGNECDRAAHSLPMELLSQMGHMNVESAAGSVTAVSCVPSDQISHVGSTRSRKSTGTQIKCDYAGCMETFRCNSEYKKHKRKHDKPFKCTEPDCKRTQGFTTINDLDRHKKSVHQVDVHNKSYKCAGKNCRNKDKVWPRLDNFKQHVKQMHRNENITDVIERSRLQSERQPTFAGDESAMAHMGASLVLDGMDKSLPPYPVMSSSSPLASPLKRDQQDYPSFDWNPDVMKEEHRKPRFSDEASLAAQSNRCQEQRVAQRRAPGLSLARQTQIPLPSDVSMDCSPKKAISDAPQSNMNYGLSNAPQTKAEQQRMARKRSVTVPPLTEPADLDHILSMLQQANGPAKEDNESTGKVRPEPNISSDSNAVILTKRDALQIAKLIKAAQAAAHQTGKGIAPQQIICPRDDCGHTVTRECDMRKHMKRHDKPYGCTYSVCHKRFGAKSDWKRHENSQHFQPEAFRCAFETSPGAVCGTYSHRLEMFEAHLEIHRVSSPRILKDLTQRSKIGKNCQETFWCGLCKAIIQLKTRRNAAWDERFDHIAQHLEKEKRSIDDWVCVEQSRTKKELREEKEKDTSGVENTKDKDDDSESTGGEEDEDGDDLLPQPPDLPPPPPPPPVPMAWTMPRPPPPSFGQESSRKREAPSDADYTDRQSKQKRRRTLTTTYCCCCHNGPCGSMQASCIECGHVLCSSCTIFTEEFIMNGTMELYE